MISSKEKQLTFDEKTIRLNYCQRFGYEVSMCLVKPRNRLGHSVENVVAKSRYRRSLFEVQIKLRSLPVIAQQTVEKVWICSLFR